MNMIIGNKKMYKLKKKMIYLSVVCLIILFSITGCTKKNALTVDEFNKIARNQDFSVTENKEFDADTYIDVIEGSKAKFSNKWEANFFVLSGDQDAKIMFEKDKNIIKVHERGGKTVRISNDFPNYSTYKLTTNENYYYVCRVDNTVLYINAPKQYKDDIENFIEKLGY